MNTLRDKLNKMQKKVSVNGKKYKIEKLIIECPRSEIYLVSREKVFYTYKKVKCNYHHIMNQIDNPKVLNDDKIIKIIDYHHDTKKNIFEVLSEYYIGPDLYFFVEHENITEEKLKFYIKKMSLCVKVCHDKDIIHLDVKPENFVLRNKEPLDIVLIDFEFSQNLKIIDTKRNNICGTPNYCSPEMLLYKTYSKKSDIWSIGCCVYTLFTCLETEIRDKHFNTQWGNELYKLNLGKPFSREMVNFLNKTMGQLPYLRPTIDELINDPWLTTTN